MASIPDFDDPDSDGEGEAMTAAEVLQKLEEAWLNEKFSPTLLENKVDIVECMMAQVQEMEDNIQRAKKADFKVSLHRMEIDRIRYILSSYLRLRLHKIEKYSQHILEAEKSSQTSLLSPEELAFAQEYQSSTDNHLTSMVLRQMPPNLQKLDPKQTTLHPNLDGYVFFRVSEDVEGVMVEEETTDNREEIVDLAKGDQHVMRYRPIADLINSGAVVLI